MTAISNNIIFGVIALTMIIATIMIVTKSKWSSP